MKKLSHRITGIALLAMGLVSAQTPTPVPTRVLNLTGCGGYVHSNAINALTSMLNTNAAAWNLTVTSVANGANFTLPYLRGFDVLVFSNNTTLGLVITGTQQTAFQQWMAEGGGVVGIHGALDHGNSWAWYTANMALSNFSGHSSWGADLNAQVRRDSVATAGVVRANNPEYALLWASLPTPYRWTWPDEWYSFTSNPRTQVDMLMTIDENTFAEAGTSMGDHPVTWAMKMPVGGTGRQGRFFYSSRGHETSAITDANAGNLNRTRNMVHFGLCWAASGGTTPRQMTSATGSCTATPTPVKSEKIMQSGLRVGVQGNDLRVNVSGSEAHEIQLLDLSGRLVATRTGVGESEYTFANLKGSGVFTVQIKTDSGNLTRRVAL